MARKKTDNPPKERLQFDLLIKEIAVLENSKEINDFATRAEALRSILFRFYETLLELNPEHTIELPGKDGQLAFRGKVKLLLRLAR